MQNDEIKNVSLHSSNAMLCEVPDRNLVYWFGIEDFKTKIKSNVYKNVINDKFYIDMFNKDGKQICFNKELPNEESCYEHHHIVIDDYTSNPDEYE